MARARARWRGDVEYAFGFDQPVDISLERFCWREVPTGYHGQAFWLAWNSRKVELKRAGFEVDRADDGRWLVRKLTQHELRRRDTVERMIFKRCRIVRGWGRVSDRQRRHPVSPR